MAGEDIESGAGKNRGGGANYAIHAEERDTQWISWMIPVFIVANIAVFVMEMYVNNCPKHIGPGNKCVARFLGRFSFQPLSENPLLGPSASTLEKMGGLQWTKIVHQHQGWRLISSIWLHAGIIHLVSNVLCIALVGIRLEQQCGFVRIGAIYLLSGFGGSILSSLFIQNSISVGASGALFGLLGAMLSELITNWNIYTHKVAALLTILVIVIINLAVGILPHVDNFAHIGGFLTGFLLGFVLLPRPQLGWVERHNIPADLRVKSKYKAYQYVLWLVSLVLLIAGLTVGLVMLFRGKNGYEHCHWCRYLTCVPTSKWKCDGE
ncbi:RHOMBOID-like protein 2 [Coffea arabica]|uniref:RHOMBOID-like protein n=1 Tax=Coffea arabica TaxID=13443 RepID=A0A6P6VLD1_COFAR|nr:RHOMBOID-like protein 2 [Coffea arabica]